jgi:hypothetical protein
MIELYEEKNNNRIFLIILGKIKKSIMKNDFDLKLSFLN